MYTTCLWCNQALGRNEVVEQFPVGRRLAFDSAKGRLWVVCPKCERWNLTPVEERWEAIEACERGYRDTRTRASTGEIGLAKLKEGLELVRIGAPLLPEFASWRYGDQFGRRFRRTAVLTGAGMVAVSGLLVGQFALGMSVMGMINFISPFMQLYRRNKRATTLDLPSGAQLPVTIHAASLVRVDARSLDLRLAMPKDTKQIGTKLDSEYEDVFQALDRQRMGFANMSTLSPHDFWYLEGPAARSALGRLLPVINREGGSRGTVADGVRLIEKLGTVDDRAGALLRGRLSHTAPLGTADKARRLALEMAVHEADERRWLEGELADLEARWKDAEALAAIADRLPDLPPAKSNR
jgi:hypothetical protein